MCGICGFATTTPAVFPAVSVLEEMVAALRQRGPDESGRFVNERVALGHARLSIIDLAGGLQPLANEDHSVTVVCNGEIYNFAELRAELIRRGHVFRTNSDCEVIAHLWEEHGPRCVERLRGMFAFVLFDARTQTVFGARDRFGQKPLFYCWNGARFGFASEIKGLLPLPGLSRRLDRAALDQFLFFHYVPSPLTLFADVRQLPAGHWFRLDLGPQREHAADSGRDDASSVSRPHPTHAEPFTRQPPAQSSLVIERYWQPEFFVDTRTSDAAHLEAVEAALREAVESHLVSDVPVGVFLSGGIDSSLVTAFATQRGQRPLQSFAITFPGQRQDEAEFSQSASQAFGTQHRAFPFSPGDLTTELERLARILDQPLADAAALPLSALSQQAAQHVKVVLTGDGGDELFAGYEKYRRAAGDASSWPMRLAALLDRRLPGCFSADQLALCAPDPFHWRRMRARAALRWLPVQECLYNKHCWESWDRFALYKPGSANALPSQFVPGDEPLRRSLPQPTDTLNQMLLTDQLGYLAGDLLPKSDYCTMAHGLEARAPFLDHQLAAVAARLPAHLKATATETKVALRRIAERWLPPLLTQRRKHGFKVPLKDWFRQDLRDWTRKMLLTDSQTVPRFFQPATVDRLLTEHASGRRNSSTKIFTLLCFELWHRHYQPTLD